METKRTESGQTSTGPQTANSKTPGWHLHKEGCTITEPMLYRPWIHYLENGTYGLRISHLGDALSTTLQEPRVAVTNYDFWEPNMGRFLYIQDEEGHWSPSYLPAEVELDSYSCTHKIGATEFCSSLRGVEVESKHFLPMQGNFEFWHIRIKNKSSRSRSVSVYSLAELLLYPNHGVDPTYFSWFTNSQYQSTPHSATLEYSRTNDDDVFGFIHTLGSPSSYDGSLRDFTGNGTMRNPEGVKNRKLKNSHSGGDRMGGSFQFSYTLEPGAGEEVVLMVGVGRECYRDMVERFPSITTVEQEYKRVLAHWKERVFHKEILQLGGLEVSTVAKTKNPIDTPNAQSIQSTTPSNPNSKENLANYLQTFFPYQIIQQGLGMVRNPFRGFRDVAQDVIGLSYFDMAGAKQLILDLPTRMYSSGRALRQWNTSGGYQDERDFHDLGPWLILAVHAYLKRGGDPSILEEQCSYIDTNRKESLFLHMVRAVEYVLNFGPHGLLEMGVGDWNDALSGMGLQGESLWLNEFLYYAIGLLEEIAKEYHKELPFQVDALQDKLYKGVMEGWTGEWFLRGYTEQGECIGGKERIFLLPQAWFTISGMAERNPEIGAKALQSMVTKLRSNVGLLLCYPPFDKPDPRVGNLSALAPGMAENFAVYNHGSMFGVYALFQGGFQEEGIEFLLKALPFTKDVHKTHAEPYVLVNFYNGGYYPEKAERGGIPWLTGTVAWLSMVLFDYVLPKNLYPQVVEKL